MPSLAFLHRRHAILLAVLALLPVSARAAEPAPTPAKEYSLDDRLDPAVIYRYDPLTEKLAPIARKDLKAGHIYLRPGPSGGKHMWSRFDESGDFRYELGPGSSFPVRLFDPVADQETRRKALEKRAPELARRLATQGARPSLRLDENNRSIRRPTRGGCSTSPPANATSCSSAAPSRSSTPGETRGPGPAAATARPPSATAAPSR